MQYALKYIAACWDADLVGNILGSPYQARRVAASSAAENVALLTILLPDAAEAAKPALASACTQKHALAALTSLVQARTLFISLPLCRACCPKATSG